MKYVFPLLIAALLLSWSSQAFATQIIYSANLDGLSEAPPNASPGKGFAEVIIDTALNSMEVQVTFSGLIAGTTASHIHSRTASPFSGTAIVATTVPTFPLFPLGVTSGSYDRTFDLTLASSYNPVFIMANGGTTATAEAALLAGLAANEAYLNIHTSFAPGGEIRGFLVATPEPSSLLLLGSGVAGAGFRRWRQRRTRAVNRTTKG